jgi:hypothetical protein
VTQLACALSLNFEDTNVWKQVNTIASILIKRT